MSEQSMRRHGGWAVGLRLVIAGVLLAACGQTGADTKGADTRNEPARLEPDRATGLKRVILSPKAAERLDIQTTPVAEEAVLGVIPRTVIPYAAVVYDPSGRAWTYTNPLPRTFVRQPITVDRIAGDRALLSSGPPTGTAVVWVGAAELFGIENEVGH